MTDLEMRVEALIRCVDPEVFAKAMGEVRKESRPVRFRRADKPSVHEIQKAAREILSDLGMPAHIEGYRHCVTALRLLIEHPDYQKALTKELFPAVAQLHDTVGQRVSRTIRHAVECVWVRGDFEVLERHWGNSVKPYTGRPTNGEFLAKCTELLRERLGIEDT